MPLSIHGRSTESSRRRDLLRAVDPFGGSVGLSVHVGCLPVLQRGQLRGDWSSLPRSLPDLHLLRLVWTDIEVSKWIKRHEYGITFLV